MPIKNFIPKWAMRFFIYIALVALSLFLLTQPIILFAGISLSLATISLLVIICLYRIRETILAAFVIYGCAVLMSAINLQMGVIYILAVAFISYRMKNNPNGLIQNTLLFWLLIGGPLMAITFTIANGEMAQISIFIILKEIITALISSLFVDILFTYGPLKQMGGSKKGFRFNCIMIHTTLVAITIPYLIYMSFNGYKNTLGIIDLADGTFVSQMQAIESHLKNHTNTDLFALKHHGVVQVSRLNQILGEISADSGTEIVITNLYDMVIGSNLEPLRGENFVWYRGGSVAAEFSNIFYWVPNGEFKSQLEKWSYAYVIREKVFYDMQLKVVIMMPFESFLSNLLSLYISQLWVYLFFCSGMIFLSILFEHIFFKPLAKLADTTTGIPARLAGQNQIEWNKSSIVEIDTLACNFKTVADNLKSMFHRTHRLAYYDLLTGLPNRLSMQDALNSLFQCSSKDSFFALLFFDLDRFKQVNDSLGHAVGDRLLKEISARLATIESDTIRVFRISGDEFVVIGEQMDQEWAECIAQHILGLIRKPVYIDQHELHITSSIGIALYPKDGDNAETLMRFADASMYIAKEEGRNTYSFYTESFQTRLNEQLWLENQLRKVLDTKQLTIYYQAIVDGVTSEIQGIEALIRWNHPQKGFISPSQFIPVAEQSGLIIPVGKWVLREACLQNKKWQDAGFPKIRVAVNLSARQFYNERIIEEIRMILDETGLEPRYLELEITEGFMIKDVDYVNKVLRQLKDMGVTISIDDFGTGYSSLKQLKHFPISVVKIDKSFVRSVGTNRNNSSIVKAIIALAHGMNLKVVAEGIEIESERSFLKRYHCDEMQGHYFYQPMNKESFTQMWEQCMDNSKVIEGVIF
ncbi:UNVERIFIED_CONTAM: diguanylate cyclase (GGDEF)-like protein [Acetivibrio alkalicellulosi]